MGLLGFLDGKARRKARGIAEYNLGLEAKYAGDWKASLRHNQQAVALNSTDEAGWWNLAIAATALSDWSEARRGWIACGITPDHGAGEVSTPTNWACVRLAPEGAAEVVWGERIDPARMRIRNVPLPDSGRRYDDIILNDGAPEGTRTSGGQEYPVFNELAVWKRSPYSTYGVQVRGGGEEAIESLERLCEERAMQLEDWGTVRKLCAECSLGSPGEHVCEAMVEDGTKRLGIAAKSRAALDEMLKIWLEVNEGLAIGPVEDLVVGGVA